MRADRPSLIVELPIDELDDEGAGVGCTAGGESIAVAGALPGERVRARIEHRSPHAPRAWGSLGEILLRSASRVAPACPAFGRCGGCSLQHLDYPGQLVAKRQSIQRALARAGVEEDALVEPVTPSPRTLGYRNRTKLVAAAAPDGRLVLGAYRPRSHEVVDLAGCRIVEPPLDEIACAFARLADRAEVPPFDERTRQGLLRYLLARSTAAGEILLLLVVASFDHPALPALERVARELAERAEVRGVTLHENASRGGALLARAGSERRIHGEATIVEPIAGLAIETAAATFLQVNRDQATALYAAVEQAVGSARRILDGYAGVGVEALLLARGGREVIAVERDAQAVAAGRRSAERLGLVERLRFLPEDAAHAFAQLAKGGERFDAVVVNPPRKGLADALAPLARLAPRRIVYVSCSPTSLAHDLAALARAGHRLAAPIVPFDLFPGTPHVECLALLERDERASG